MVKMNKPYIRDKGCVMTSTMNRLKVITLCTVTAVLLVSGSCSKSTSNKTDDSLVIVGTGSCEEILKKLAEAFNQTQGDFEVVVPKSIGSGGGIKAVGNDEFILGRVARQIKDKEAHFGLTYLPFAKDPIIFAVGNNAKVTSLTTEQIIGIYSGEITNWQQLGGTANPIRVIGREKGETSRTNIEKKLKSFADIENQEHIKVVYHDYEVVNMFDKYFNAIGYLTSSSLNQNIHPVSIDDVLPDLENISSGRYPLVTEYAFVYKKKCLNEKARRFIDFVFSERGRAILEANNISPVSRK